MRAAPRFVLGCLVAAAVLAGCSSSTTSPLSSSHSSATANAPTIVVDGVTVRATPALCGWADGPANWSQEVGDSFVPVSKGAGAGDARGGKLKIAIRNGHGEELIALCHG
jgi:hypothetical protein